MSYLGHPDQQFGCVSYSQHGEDLVFCALFKMLEVDWVTYLDLGAHDPTIISNTRLLYERGATGVNIEANPYLIEKFKLERPRDQNICLGVAPTEGEKTLYMYSDTSGWNTLSPEEVARMAGAGRVHKEIQVKTKTLDQIVNEYCEGVFPDFLNCDIEGLDYEVLASSLIIYDPKVAPKVICVETRPVQRAAMISMMSWRGFSLYARLMENLIFVHRSSMRKILD